MAFGVGRIWFCCTQHRRDANALSRKFGRSVAGSARQNANSGVQDGLGPDTTKIFHWRNLTFGKVIVVGNSILCTTSSWLVRTDADTLALDAALADGEIHRGGWH